MDYKIISVDELGRNSVGFVRRANAGEQFILLQEKETGFAVVIHRIKIDIFVKQRSKNDCAVAVVAMFLNKQYDEIVNDFPELRENFEIGTSWGSVCNVLHKHGVKVECHKYTSNIFRINEPAILSVASLNYIGKYHFIYWDGKRVYDPSNLRCYAEFPKEKNIFYVYQQCED